MKRSGGFTLPEVLATMVLVGIIVPVAMRGVSVALQASAAAKRMTEAGQLARTKLNELLVTRDSSQFESSGNFGDAWPGYRYVTHGLPGDGNLYDVTVTVYWPDRGGEQSLMLATAIYPSDIVNVSTPAAGGTQ